MKNEDPCCCGCGTPTKGFFAPGHDNRFYGQVIRGERPVEDLALYPGLQRKWAGRNKPKVAPIHVGESGPEMTTVDPDGFVDIAPPATGPTFTEVKDGRWWYPVKKVTLLDDGRFEVEWKAKNGNARTTRVAADKLR